MWISVARVKLLVEICFYFITKTGSTISVYETAFIGKYMNTNIHIYKYIQGRNKEINKIRGNINAFYKKVSYYNFLRRFTNHLKK